MTRKPLKERRQAITGVTVSGISLAAELISSNVDLLTEILLRLPARSLIRFKCVSKHWLSLISHSQFASNHSSRNPRPSISGLYLYFYSRILSVSLLGRRNLPSLSFLDGFGEQSPTRVLHFCNGLLLCYKSHSGSHIHRRSLIVCNTSTKERTILPSSHISEPWRGVSAYLAFDPSKSPHYKVLLFCYVSSFASEIVVYCSQSACWKQVTIQQKCWGRGVFWNGAIHWFSLENSLVRFAVDAEEVIIMPNPQTPKILTPDKIDYFGESGDCLILIQSKLRFPLGFRILELDKNYCGWIVKCRVNLRPLIATFPDIINCAREVLRVSKGDKERDFTLVLAFSGKIVSYDLTRKTWDVLYDGELGTIDFSRVYPIIEILSPV